MARLSGWGFSVSVCIIYRSRFRQQDWLSQTEKSRYASQRLVTLTYGRRPTAAIQSEFTRRYDIPQGPKGIDAFRSSPRGRLQITFYNFWADISLGCFDLTQFLTSWENFLFLAFSLSHPKAIWIFFSCIFKFLVHLWCFSASSDCCPQTAATPHRQEIAAVWHAQGVMFEGSGGLIALVNMICKTKMTQANFDRMCLQIQSHLFKQKRGYINWCFKNQKCRKKWTNFLLYICRQSK